MNGPDLPKLREWQEKFIAAFSESSDPKTFLIAAPGTGKTVTAIRAVQAKIAFKKETHILVITDRMVLRDQWKHAAEKFGLHLSSDLNARSVSGLSITHQSLLNGKNVELLKSRIKSGSAIAVFDDAHDFVSQVERISNMILDSGSSNQCLFISNKFASKNRDGEKYEYGLEYAFQPQLIKLPETKIEIARYSPSTLLLSDFRRKILTIDDINWRQFEKLISELLESDGYSIELMRGTKDGGVDVVAVKDLGESGLFKTLWQAKKNRLNRKIGIEKIRELADVRNEFSASKALIVTTSFLTGGALSRILRDKFILGKVDRLDLQKWIDRKIRE
jgi:hypothetical protein